jgi:hypothetical protein
MKSGTWWREWWSELSAVERAGVVLLSLVYLTYLASMVVSLAETGNFLRGPGAYQAIQLAFVAGMPWCIYGTLRPGA